MANTHVFISYSRKTPALVEKADTIVAVLKRRGIPVWIDRTGLVPGTPDWQQKIRQVIGHASASILLASPSAAESRYVLQECQLAEVEKCPIYPVWIEGDSLPASVPMGLSTTQAVDVRELNTTEVLESKLEQLFVELRRRIPAQFAVNIGDLTDGFLTVALENGPCIAINPLCYPTLEHMMDELYMTYMRDLYRPYTYAQDWLLVSGQGKHHNVQTVVCSWGIMMRPRQDMPLRQQHRDWAAKSPSTYKLEPDSFWSIRGTQDISVMGLLTNRKGYADDLYAIARENRAAPRLDKMALYGNNVHEPATVNPRDYRHRTFAQSVQDGSKV